MANVHRVNGEKEAFYIFSPLPFWWLGMSSTMQSKSSNVKQQPLVKFTTNKVISLAWNCTMLQSHSLSPPTCLMNVQSNTGAGYSPEAFTKNELLQSKTSPLYAKLPYANLFRLQNFNRGDVY